MSSVFQFDYKNLGLQTDSYKLTHIYGNKNLQLTKTYAWIGGRKGTNGPDYQVAVGQQHIAATIKSFKLTTKDVDVMDMISTEHLGPGIFNRTPFDKIVENGGYIPMKIYAVPEGTIVPRGVAIMIVESTSAPELVPFLEAHLQRIWYPTSVATRTTEFRNVVHKFLLMTTEPEKAKQIFPFCIHDFGTRACSTNEQSEIGGLAALEAGILGSDNLPAIMYAMRLMPDIEIGASSDKIKIPAYSVAAGEHNVAFSFGELKEMEPVETALEKYKKGIVSWPIDSFNSQRFVESMVKPGKYRDLLMARDGKFVFRPDSPWEKGMSHAETVFACLKCIELNLSDLDPTNGGIKINAKGYAVLPDWLGIIYGDSVTVNDVYDIYSLITQHNWSAENIVFGVGGNLLQNNITRGWLDFAMKCSQQTYLDIETGEIKVMDVGKKTPGKESPTGRFKVIQRDGKIQMVSENDGPEPNMMIRYYEDGEIFNFEPLQTIRDRVASYTNFNFDK